MKRGFLLIEIIISILLLSLSTLALTKLNGSTIDIFTKIESNRLLSKDISLMINYVRQGNHKTSKTPYDILSKFYTIDNFDVKKQFNKHKYAIDIQKKHKEDLKIITLKFKKYKYIRERLLYE